MLQCTVGQIVYMPVPQFVEVIVDAVPMKALFFCLEGDCWKENRDSTSCSQHATWL